MSLTKPRNSTYSVQLETFMIKIEESKNIGELEASVRTTYAAAMLQEVVASTIMTPADVDKPYPQTTLYLS